MNINITVIGEPLEVLDRVRTEVDPPLASIGVGDRRHLGRRLVVPGAERHALVVLEDRDHPDRNDERADTVLDPVVDRRRAEEVRLRIELDGRAAAGDGEAVLVHVRVRQSGSLLPGQRHGRHLCRKKAWQAGGHLSI